MMDDQQLLRYSRQIMLPQIDLRGQQKILDACILIVGLGGLGSPISMYLAAAGIGRLVIADFDQVDITNLQRQILYHSNMVGNKKTDSAYCTLKNINPDVKVKKISEKMDEIMLAIHVRQVDIVIDATDNFDIRFLMNKVCVAERKPMISGAAIRMEGQVTVFRNDKPNSPCYRCLYEEQNTNSETCSDTGIIAPLVGIIGSIQATEALKIIVNMGVNLTGRLLLLDALTMEWRTLRISKDPSCPVCSLTQELPQK